MIEERKQKISAKKQRLIRYNKRQHQYYHNKLFKTDGKKFYNYLGKTKPNVKYTPDKEKVENFWREIYEKKMVHNEKVCWIKDQDQSHPTMEWKQVCEKDMAEALRTTLNWKAPGKDQISNFWLKKLQHTNIWPQYKTN